MSCARKLSYPELKRAVIDQDARFSPQAILIEDRASRTQLIQELIASGCSRATRVAPEGDKIMRLHAQTATIENGFVCLPHEAPWIADYLAEFAAFPRGRHDDQVDSTAPGAGVGEPAAVCSRAGVLDRACVPGAARVGKGRLSAGGSRTGDDGASATGQAQTLGAPG
jgi:predicted phage terminase large subunit-like protein